MTRLLRGELLRVSDGPGCEVRVRAGCVWITQHHDNADYIVKAGGTFRIDRLGTTLVTAMADAALDLCEPAGEPADAPAMRLPYAA